MENKQYNREIFIIVGIIIIFMLFTLTCSKFDFFHDPLGEFTPKGYPVPQGNLSNFKYGKKHKTQDEEYKQWKQVFSRGGNAVEYYGTFRPPAPRTMLR